MKPEGSMPCSQSPQLDSILCLFESVPRPQHVFH